MANLVVSADHAFFPLNSHVKHLPRLHTILSVMSFSLVGACFRPSLSAFVVLKHPCLYVCRQCVFSYSRICIRHTQISFVSLSLVGVCYCFHAWSLAPPRPPFVSSSLDSAGIHPPSFIFTVLRPPFVSSSLESVCFCPPPSVLLSSDPLCLLISRKCVLLSSSLYFAVL